MGNATDQPRTIHTGKRLEEDEALEIEVVLYCTVEDMLVLHSSLLSKFCCSIFFIQICEVDV